MAEAPRCPECGGLFRVDFRVTLVGWKRLRRAEALARIQFSRTNPRISLFFDRVAVFLYEGLKEHIHNGGEPSEDEIIDQLIWELIRIEVHELTHALMPTSKEQYCEYAEDLVLNFLARRGG